MLEVLQKNVIPGAKYFVMDNMNVSNNYRHRKNVQTAEEKKQAEKVKKEVQKRKVLAVYRRRRRTRGG